MTDFVSDSCRQLSRALAMVKFSFIWIFSSNSPRFSVTGIGHFHLIPLAFVQYEILLEKKGRLESLVMFSLSLHFLLRSNRQWRLLLKRTRTLAFEAPLNGVNYLPTVRAERLFAHVNSCNGLQLLCFGHHMPFLDSEWIASPKKARPFSSFVFFLFLTRI